MGYCYTRGGALCCDRCGESGGVRRRTCPHKVRHGGGVSLPYCQPAALCRACYAVERATLHAGCAEGAARAQATEDTRAAVLAGGGLLVKAAWGDWHPTVPAGEVGVLFEGRDRRAWGLVSSHEYRRRTGLLATMEAFEVRPWADPDGAGA